MMEFWNFGGANPLQKDIPSDPSLTIQGMPLLFLYFLHSLLGSNTIM